MCNKQFEEAEKKHSTIVFVISIIAGLVVLILGYLLISVEPVGVALVGSGIWAFFCGSVVNWRNFGNSWRFVLLLIAFVMLIWISIKLNNKDKISGRKQ